eukprot:95134-Pleurochrysis_carterae.AAC.1
MRPNHTQPFHGAQVNPLKTFYRYKDVDEVAALPGPFSGALTASIPATRKVGTPRDSKNQVDH